MIKGTITVISISFILGCTSAKTRLVVVEPNEVQGLKSNEWTINREPELKVRETK